MKCDIIKEKLLYDQSMKYNDFIKETIMDFSSIEFKNIKALLIGEYIQFSFLEDNRIDQYISEKIM